MGGQRRGQGQGEFLGNGTRDGGVISSPKPAPLPSLRISNAPLFTILDYVHIDLRDGKERVICK